MLIHTLNGYIRKNPSPTLTRDKANIEYISGVYWKNQILTYNSQLVDMFNQWEVEKTFIIKKNQLY